MYLRHNGVAGQSILGSGVRARFGAIRKRKLGHQHPGTAQRRLQGFNHIDKQYDVSSLVPPCSAAYRQLSHKIQHPPRAPCLR